MIRDMSRRFKKRSQVTDDQMEHLTFQQHHYVTSGIGLEFGVLSRAGAELKGTSHGEYRSQQSR
jgi:hypothetical protein